MTYLVLTVIGNDKPGLVESLSQLITTHDGNWLESRMARMAGKFAGILEVSLPEKNADNLVDDLKLLESKGLKIIVEKSNSEDNDQDIKVFKLNLVGNDQPGIIKTVSKALASYEINVAELITDCKSAPMSGELLFSATAEITIPKSADIELIRDDLEKISNELIVDITLE